MNPTTKRPLHQRARRTLGVALAGSLVLVAAACGGDDDDAADTTVAETLAAAPETTEEPEPTVPETTAAPATTAAPTTTQPAPPTTAAEPARMPLTGAPLAFGEVAPDRPALVVKIDNVECAHRTQVGLNTADIVFEEVVEGRLTRFAAVFHSQDSDPVGPIRSGRSQDVDMLSGLNRPLFSWSGGNAGTNAVIASSDLIDLSAQANGGGYFRTRSCGSPHNLFNNTSALFAQAPPEAGRPTPLFDYLEPDEVPGGSDASFAELKVGVVSVRWDWDAASGTYVRTENGRPHVLADGSQVSTNTVVVLANEYGTSSYNRISPEAKSVGEGDAAVFSAGKVVLGRWSRADRTSPITLTTPEGASIEITPGRTFVEMADVLDHGTTWG
jgi:hypothetical protein